MNDSQTNDFTDTRPVVKEEAEVIRRLTGQNVDQWLHLIDGT
jgi:hypothetical protein